MKTTKTTLAIAVIAVILSGMAAILYFYLIAPSADSQRESALVTYDKTIDQPFDELLVSDLGIPGARAGLVSKVGNYFEFNLSTASGSGGFEVIAELLPDRHFQTIWSGQDIPNCAPLTQFDVPAGVAPYCYDTVVIDRTNLVRSVITRIFNPYMDNRGDVSF